MALVTTDAIVLKSMRWGEADRIVTFLTLRLGKIRGIARGARKMKSRFGGTLELFSSVKLTLFDKRHDSLASVSQVDISEPFAFLRGNIERTSAASCMVALVDGVTADRDPSPSIFHRLLDGLRSLGETDDPEFLAVVFQIQALGQAGFRPQLDHCAGCGRNVGLTAPKFSPWAGGLICRSCEQNSWDESLSISPGGIAFLKQARRMSFTLARRLKATGQVRSELEDVIETYARTVVGKRLPTKNFLAAEPVSSEYGTVRHNAASKME